MSEEAWKPVVGFEGFYEVSDAGRVRSVSRPYEMVSGGITLKRYLKGRILSLKTKAQGYKFACLSVGGVHTYPHVNRMVLEAFVGPPPSPEWHGDHEDENRANNRLGNLQWLSPEANRAKRKCPKGMERPDALLNDDAVRQLRDGSLPPTAAAHRYGVTSKYAASVANGKGWQHVA